MFEFEAYEVLKTKEFTVVNDCFQNKHNEKIVSCQNARVNSTKNRVMKNQKTLSCSFNLNRKDN